MQHLPRKKKTVPRIVLLPALHGVEPTRVTSKSIDVNIAQKQQQNKTKQLTLQKPSAHLFSQDWNPSGERPQKWAIQCSFAGRMQHIQSLGSACRPRPPRDRASFGVPGAGLRECGRCLWSTVSAGPRTFLLARRCLQSTASADGGLFCLEVQHSVHRTLLLHGRCST